MTSETAYSSAKRLFTEEAAQAPISDRPEFFHPKDTLNPEIWDGDKMHPEVRERLLTIAGDFVKSLEIPGLEQADVVLTGSLASYYWTKYSDLDVHIVVDFDLLDGEGSYLDEFLNAQAAIWNDSHEILIHGFEVELFVQDAKAPYRAIGVYSLSSDKWVQEPSKDDVEVDEQTVAKKAAKVMRKIEELERMEAAEEYDAAFEKAQQLKDKIKKLRSTGLEHGGVFSMENMVFKLLRREGWLDRLQRVRLMAYDRELSMNGGAK